jgi:5-methyltetrahydropteroyltriglutamate--homocysteine methyltransferase
MQAFLTGIYPRSAELVQATRDLDRGRTSEETVAELRRGDLERLLEAQQQAGFDLIADGMLSWQDLFRPLVEASDGLEPGPLTRFLDTNTFYRQASADTVSPALSAPLGEAYFPPVDGPRVATLPSPWALAEGTGLEPAILAEHVLAPQIAALDAELVVLAEPFLARSDNPNLETLSAALEKLPQDVEVAVQFTFGDARPLLEQGAADLPVAGIGVDFYTTHVTDVPKGMNKLLLAGVVDARNSLLEDGQELATFARRLQDERELERIALVPNGDLQYVSEAIARQKLSRLGAAKRQTAEVVA